MRDGGPPLSSERDALDLMSEASAEPVDWIAVQVDQFVPAFFDLKTRLAGLFIQKLVNYGQRLAIVGDLSAQTAASDALRDFIREFEPRPAGVVRERHGGAGAAIGRRVRFRSVTVGGYRVPAFAGATGAKEAWASPPQCRSFPRMRESILTDVTGCRRTGRASQDCWQRSG